MHFSYTDEDSTATDSQLLKSELCLSPPLQQQPAIERVQALADISRSTLYVFAV